MYSVNREQVYMNSQTWTMHVKNMKSELYPQQSIEYQNDDYAVYSKNYIFSSYVFMESYPTNRQIRQ